MRISINGREIETQPGTTVLAALWNHGIAAPALCAMGVCMACRVTIDGARPQLACQTECKEGMRVEL
jgi:NADH dehydrogenase/NADH:ubiquinone oxidoreductase subunit G